MIRELAAGEKGARRSTETPGAGNQAPPDAPSPAASSFTPDFKEGKD